MRHRSAFRIVAVAAATMLVGGTATVAVAAPATDPVRLVVKLHGSTPSRAQLQASVRSLHVDSVESLGHGLAAVTVTTDDTRAAAETLEGSRLVAAASPDRRFTATGTTAPVVTKDTYFPQQWDLWDSSSTARAGGYGVDAPRAWRTTTGSAGVVVAVLDTGITPHPDLAGAHIAAGYDFVSDEDGVETGDGDGWDADPTDEGDACLALGESSSWHGTFVTGEIAAQDNRYGVTGQARGVTIEPVRVLGACGGSESDTIAAIEWSSGGAVAGVPANPQPAKVISMSLGSADGPCSDALQAAIDDAVARGTVVIAAAGNDDAAMADTSPANCSSVVSVAASTRTGALASYSNYGTDAASPTIAAPGGSANDPIIGDTWTSTTTLTASRNRPAIGTSVGTSMATPRVTSAVALLLSVQPNLSPDDIASMLVDTSIPFTARSGCTDTRCGAGIVNAGNLLGSSALFVQASRSTVSGTPKVGKRLTAHAGIWRASPQRVRYQWLRDGKAISGAVGRTYRVTAKDVGHKVGVKVWVQRTGTLTAAARSTARRVG